MLVVVAGCSTARVAGPLTVAERSNYTAASRHADVLSFLREARAVSRRTVDDGHARDSLRTTVFGVTTEGRALPLVVWGAPSATPEAVRATGKTRVLLFGGIHGGEIAGTEALLALVRDLAVGRHDAWADSLVLLVAPLYNADGADRVSPSNRPLQLGPDAGMGQRANAAGLDLNRDFVRLAAPESRALVRLIDAYDPHVVVDFHTTDGTPMAYALTYAPGLAPDTPAPLDTLLRDRWLPQITDTLEARDGFATWHYGNVPGAFGEPATAPRGWYSFSGQARYSTNYVGLRGRLGILAEAYSYAPFETRIAVSQRFAEEIVQRAWRDASLVRALVSSADEARSSTVTLRSTFAALDRPHEVLLGEVDTLAHPTTGEPRYLWRDDSRLAETMPAFVRFAPTETGRVPSAYVVHFGPHQKAVADLLRDHGIRFELGIVWGRDRERFVVDSTRVASRPYNGQTMQEVWGRWTPVAGETGDPPRLAAALIVPTDQPLGRLVATLLEPRSDDGIVAWGLVPVADAAAGDTLPVERLP
jgi:hypothetical protein